MRWWMTRRVERQATRMHEMMDRLNVDEAALARTRQGGVYAEARAMPDVRNQRQMSQMARPRTGA